MGTWFSSELVPRLLNIQTPSSRLGGLSFTGGDAELNALYAQERSAIQEAAFVGDALRPGVNWEVEGQNMSNVAAGTMQQVLNASGGTDNLLAMSQYVDGLKEALFKTDGTDLKAMNKRELFRQGLGQF